MKSLGKNLPKVVSQAEWQTERDKLLVKEKAHMRASDALAAERRRLPMVKIDKEYTFDGVDGEASLLDLFHNRRQLIVYHFMYHANEDRFCDGCCFFVDQIPHLAHLHARDTSLALISRAPQSKLKQFKKRMGWTVPWYSSLKSDFNYDFGISTSEGENFGLSVFLRDDGDSLYRTYFTDKRAVEAIGTVWSLLDLTPLGRQETWEGSPEGWPQTPPYEWWRYHDSYREVLHNV